MELKYRAYRRIELIQMFNERELNLIIMMENKCPKRPISFIKNLSSYEVLS